MEDSTKVHAPPVIRLEWLQGGPNHVIQSMCGRWLVTFDPLTRAAGCYEREAGIWAVWGPMAVGEFAHSLRARSIELPEGIDLHCWLDAVTGVEHMPTGSMQ